MLNDQKTKAELLQELDSLRNRVSELKQVQEALKHSEKQFKELFEKTVVGIYRTTPDGRIIMVNPALVRMLGYSSFEELSQRNLEKEGFAPQYPRSIFEDLIEREGKVVGLESAWLRKDGTRLFITENARVIRDEHGKTLYYEGIVQDITERKEAEDKIKRAEEEWSKIFDATSDLVFVQDKDSKLIKVNKSVCDVLKVKPEDLIGKKCYEVLHKSDKPWPNCPTVKALKDKRPHTEEVYDPNIGIPLLISTSPLFDENGELTGVVHIAKDITERKRAEEALRVSEERYRTLFESSRDGIATANMKGYITECNQAYADMLGYSREELKKIRYQDITPCKWHAFNEKTFQEVMEHGYSNVFEKEYIKKDGTLFPVSLHTWRIDEDGKPVGVGSVVRDITERKEAEERIRILSFAVEQSIDGIAIGDLEPKFVYVNDAFARMHSYTPEEMIGMPVTKLHDKEQMDEYKKAVNQLKTHGSWEGEIGHIRKDGKVFLTYVSVTLLKNSEGKPKGTLAVTRDITESKRREEELNIYRENMVQAEELAAVGTLSATMAHELTQPLTVIRLSIQNSLAELDTMSCPGTVVEDLKEGLSEISSMTSMLDRFRNFARMSTKRTVSEVDLKAAAERIVKLLDEGAWRAKVTLQVEGMDKLPLIYSYERDLEHLLFSLTENAIQATDGKKKRQVIISGAVRDEHIELQFSDNCGGIAPENLDKIFEPFFTTKHTDERMGLGLCVVQRILSQLGGKIRVESKLGKGSTFFVILPIDRCKK
jgi:PAS domain S-box-containing protein